MTKPPGQKETIDQTWYALYGTPGNPGLVERIATLEDKIANGSGNHKKAKTTLWVALGVLVSLNSLGLLRPLQDVVFSWFQGGG